MLAAGWCDAMRYSRRNLMGAMMGTTVQFRPHGSTAAWTSLGVVPAGSDLQMIAPDAPPNPGGPSADGTKATQAGVVLVDDSGARWQIAADRTVQWCPQGAAGFTAAGHTSNVTGIEKWRTTCAQWVDGYPAAGQTGWWQSSVTGSTVTWAQIPGDPSTGPTPPAGAWGMAGGQLFLGGKLWIPYGVALLDAMIGQVSPATLKQQFPSSTAVNLAIGADNNGCLSAQPIANIINWIDAAYAAGMVTMVSDYRPGQPAVRSGQDLANALNWLSQLVTHYKGTQKIILTTENEVIGKLAGEHQATYNMVRSIDALVPIFFEAQAGNATSTGGLDPAIYTTMHGAGFNVHIYPWEFNTGSQNQADYDNTSRGYVQKWQSFAQSADGAMPVLMGEGGNSTSGSGVPPDDPKIA